MMNQFVLSFLIILLGSMPLKGQILEPVFVVESNSNIKTKTVSKKRIKSRPGTTLEYGAKLFLKKNQRVTLYMNGDFVVLEGKSKHKLVKDENALDEAKTLNFDALFAEYLKSSFGIANQNVIKGNIGFASKHNGDGWSNSDGDGADSDGDDAEIGGGVSDPKSRGGWGVTDPGSRGGWGVTDPKSRGGWGVTDPKSRGGWGVTEPKTRGGWGVSDPKSRGGWGVTDPKSRGGWGVTDPKSRGAWGVTDPGSRGGWGKEDMTIEVMTPGGVYKMKSNTLRWFLDDDVDQYLVCIFDEDLKLVFSEISTSGFINVDMSNLNANKTYFWQIFANGKRAISMPITFTLAGEDMLELITLNCDNSDMYCKIKDEALKGLMEAAAFESSNMYLEALNKYQTLVDDYPKNNLVRISFAAYYLRMGQYGLAKDHYSMVK